MLIVSNHNLSLHEKTGEFSNWVKYNFSGMGFHDKSANYIEKNGEYHWKPKSYRYDYDNPLQLYGYNKIKSEGGCNDFIFSFTSYTNFKEKIEELKANDYDISLIESMDSFQIVDMCEGTALNLESYSELESTLSKPFILPFKIGWHV